MSNKTISNLADNHSWLSAFLANCCVDYILGKQVAYVQLGEIRIKELCLNYRKGGIYGDY